MKTKKYFLDILYLSDLWHFTNVGYLSNFLNNPKYSVDECKVTSYHYNEMEFIFVSNHNFNELYDYLDRVCSSNQLLY